MFCGTLKENILGTNAGCTVLTTDNPESETLNGLPKTPVKVTLRVAVRLPRCVGTKLAWTLQFAPLINVPVQVFNESVKSAALVPVKETAILDIVEPLVFVMVKFLGLSALVCVSTVVAKA